MGVTSLLIAKGSTGKGKQITIGSQMVEMVHHYSPCITGPFYVRNLWPAELHQACYTLLSQLLQWHSTACPTCYTVGCKDALQIAPQVEVDRNETSGCERPHIALFCPNHQLAYQLSKYCIIMERIPTIK
jgi:hypothetical protein